MSYPRYRAQSSEYGAVSDTATVSERKMIDRKKEEEEGVSISEQSVFSGDGPTFCRDSQTLLLPALLLLRSGILANGLRHGAICAGRLLPGITPNLCSPCRGGKSKTSHPRLGAGFLNAAAGEQMGRSKGHVDRCIGRCCKNA